VNTSDPHIIQILLLLSNRLGVSFFAEEHVQSAVCQTLRAISRQNNDVIKNYADILLPLVFLAMHQKKTPGKLRFRADCVMFGRLNFPALVFHSFFAQPRC